MKHRFSPLLAIPLLFTAACEEKQVALEEVTLTTLGVEGGSAFSAAGELSLTFESGVLPANTQVRIKTNRSKHPLASSHSAAIYELSTEPAVSSFSRSVALTLDVSRIKAGRYVVANFDGAEPQVLTTRRQGNKITADLPHFSSYGAWPDPNGADCPVDSPSGSDTCTVEGLECNYGQECCCGQCYPSLVASCSGGVWAIRATDACLGGESLCSDAGVPEQDGGIEPEQDGGIEPEQDGGVEPPFVDGGASEADGGIEPEQDGGGLETDGSIEPPIETDGGTEPSEDGGVSTVDAG